MTKLAVKPGGKRSHRAGARATALLTAPLNLRILRALAEEPRRLVDLRHAADQPPEATLRLYLRALADGNLVAKRKLDAFPGVLRYELLPAGRQLITVAGVFQDWLAEAPSGPVAMGERGAKNAIKALADGWDTGMLRALAARPFSLTELAMLISDVPYPSLERRLSAMRSLGLVVARPRRGNGNATPYAVTEWMRRGVAPLAAAARWEHEHFPAEGIAVSRRDAETIFLLAIPLIGCLPEGLSGSCRLAVETKDLSGITAEIEKGRIVNCTSRLEGNTDAWALGAVQAWFAAVIERDSGRLQLGGERDLARSLLSGLHEVLFGTVSKS